MLSLRHDILDADADAAVGTIAPTICIRQLSNKLTIHQLTEIGENGKMKRVFYLELFIIICAREINKPKSKTQKSNRRKKRKML